MSQPETVDNGYGTTWPLCGPGCGLEVVRPGKVQCVHAGCPAEVTDPQTSPCTLAEADEDDSDRVMPPSGWGQ